MRTRHMGASTTSSSSKSLLIRLSDIAHNRTTDIDQKAHAWQPILDSCAPRSWVKGVENVKKVYKRAAQSLLVTCAIDLVGS